MGSRKPREIRSVKIRYAVFTEGKVTEKQYLELLHQRLRPRHATFSIKPVGGEPSRVFKEYQKAERRGDVDRAILIVDVDDHHRLDEVLRKCKSSAVVDTIVSNPCFEIWLIWHQSDLRKYVSSEACQDISDGKRITDEKHLTRTFQISDYDTAIERAKAAWADYGPNKIGPNPSSAMPWLIDLMTTPPKG